MDRDRGGEVVSEQIIIAVVTGVCGLLGGGCASALVSHFSTRRDRLSHAYAELAKAQLDMQAEIDAQDAKLRRLFAENDELRDQLVEVQYRDDAKTAYLRDLFHWLAKLCDVIDPEWLSDNPKPSLPDELRHDIAPDTIRTE